MFFGAHTVIDARCRPYEYMDALAVIIVFLPIVVTILVLWGVAHDRRR